MKDKQNIRYVGFECTDDGGRRFGFSVTVPDQVTALISVDIAGLHFAGSNRILVQEAPGICYLKVKELCEIGTISDVPNRVCLSGTDIGQYRQILPTPGRRKQK